MPRSTPPAGGHLPGDRAQAAHRAALAVLRSANLIRRQVGSVVEAEGITLQQFNVLRILRGAGDTDLPTLEVAERLIDAAPGVTRLLDRLEEKQLISRTRCPHDRRRVLCRLTEDGRDLLARLDQPVLEAEAGLMAPLPATVVHGLHQGLEDLLAAHDETKTERRQEG